MLAESKAPNEFAAGVTTVLHMSPSKAKEVEGIATALVGEWGKVDLRSSVSLAIISLQLRGATLIFACPLPHGG